MSIEILATNKRASSRDRSSSKSQESSKSDISSSKLNHSSIGFLDQTIHSHRVHHISPSKQTYSSTGFLDHSFESFRSHQVQLFVRSIKNNTTFHLVSYIHSTTFEQFPRFFSKDFISVFFSSPGSSTN